MNLLAKAREFLTPAPRPLEGLEEAGPEIAATIRAIEARECEAREQKELVAARVETIRKDRDVRLAYGETLVARAHARGDQIEALNLRAADGEDVEADVERLRGEARLVEVNAAKLRQLDRDLSAEESRLHAAAEAHGATWSELNAARAWVAAYREAKALGDRIERHVQAVLQTEEEARELPRAVRRLQAASWRPIPGLDEHSARVWNLGLELQRRRPAVIAPDPIPTLTPPQRELPPGATRALGPTPQIEPKLVTSS